MSSSGLVIPPDLNPVVKERTELWREFDLAIEKREKLNSLASELTGNTPPEPKVEPFTSEALPHQELAATLEHLESDFQAIREMEAEIDSCREEIWDEEARIKRNRIITRVIIVIVVLVVIYAILSGVGAF